MAAAKFGVFGNNIETTWVHEKEFGGICLKPRGLGMGLQAPSLHVALTNCFPRLLGGS